MPSPPIAFEGSSDERARNVSLSEMEMEHKDLFGKLRQFSETSVDVELNTELKNLLKALALSRSEVIVED